MENHFDQSWSVGNDPNLMPVHVNLEQRDTNATSFDQGLLQSQYLQHTSTDGQSSIQGSFSYPEVSQDPNVAKLHNSNFCVWNDSCNTSNLCEELLEADHFLVIDFSFIFDN